MALSPLLDQKADVESKQFLRLECATKRHSNLRMLELITMISGWKIAEAQRVVEALIRRIGLRETHYRLISFRQNALFHLPDSGFTVRVYYPDEDPSRAELMVRCARWLEAESFPAVRLSSVLKRQPTAILGCQTSVWQWIDKDPENGYDASAFGNLLRRFHDLSGSPDFSVPSLDPLGKIRMRLDRLRKHGLIRDDHLEILEATYRRAEQLAPHVCKSGLGSGFLHGDALRGNAILSNGELILIDFDSICQGPREWDLVPTAIAIKRFARGDHSTWSDFLLGYGVAESALSDLDAAMIIKELSMTVFLCLSSGQSEEIEKEIDWRIGTWARWDMDAPWHSPIQV